MNLDDRSEIRQVDQSDMLGAIEKTAERLAPPQDAELTCQLKVEHPRSVVIAGVGGSGIVGDIMGDYCRDSNDLPVTVCRSFRIPRFVGRDTLVVTISYSGETRETIGMFEQARQAGADVVVVTSGGELLRRSAEQKVPYVRVTGGMIQRVALPELVAATTYALSKASVIPTFSTLLNAASSAVRDLTSRIGPSVPLEGNPAKQMATALNGRLPLIIGAEENASILRRFKNELNENSKVPAIVNTLPEAYHDDVEGLQALQQLSKPQPIILRGNEIAGEAKVEEKLVDVLTQLGLPRPQFFSGSGKGRFEWLLSAITFGDFVSVYLSAIRRVDPSILNLIPTFRAIRGQV